MNHVHGNTINGGPVHWIHENHRCPNCVDYQKKYARLAPKNASRTPFDEFKGWLAAEAGMVANLYNLIVLPLNAILFK